MQQSAEGETMQQLTITW